MATYNDNNNTYNGTNDSIYGDGGDDNLKGAAGNDFMDGGDGQDWLFFCELP